VDYDYVLTDSWTADFGGGWRYMSSRFFTVNDPENCRPTTPPAIQNQCLGLSYVPKLPSTSIFDAHVSVSSDLWTISLISRNITNEHAWSSFDSTSGEGPSFDRGPVLAIPLQPRLVMLSVDRRF